MAHLTDPREHTARQHSELLCDEQGIPYLDQSTAARRVKTNIRKRTPEEAERVRQRIEHVRTLLAMLMSNRDIKHACSRLWGISKRSVEAYIRAARRRNNELLFRTPVENKADSRRFWQQESLEWRNMIQKGQQQINDADKMHGEAQVMMDQAIAIKARSKTPEEKSAAVATIDTAIAMMDQARRNKSEGRDMVREGREGLEAVMDRIDKMTGNYSTKPDGSDPMPTPQLLQQNNYYLEGIPVGPDGQPLPPMTKDELQERLDVLIKLPPALPPPIVPGEVEIDPVQEAIEAERKNRGKSRPASG
jgi:hypothetical protein